MKNHFILLIFIIILTGCSEKQSIIPTPPATPTPPPPILEVGEFSLDLPENNKTCEVGTVALDKADIEFKWKAAPNATKYEIQITDVLEGKTSKFPDITGTSKILNLIRGKSYTWNIIASNAGSKTVTSALWKFYLSGDGKTNRAPNAAKAIYPTPGSTVNLNASGNVKFEWITEDPDKDVLTYTIRVDTLSSAKVFTGSAFDAKIPSQEVKLLPGKIYYWYVIANDGAISVKSDVFSFKLK